MATKVKSFNLDGKDLEVTVSDTGIFSTELNGTYFSSSTYEGLKEKLLQIRRKAKVRVSVPYSLLHGGKLSHGTLVGIHAGTNMPLARDKDGKHVPLNWLGDFMTPLDEGEAAALQKMLDDRQALNKAIAVFVQAHKLNAQRVVQEAVEKAAAQQALKDTPP